MGKAPDSVRTSLEVGFSSETLPERFRAYRGRVWRAISATDAFPYEDDQFDVVLLDRSAVSRAAVKEANRVLRAEGTLAFTVTEGGNGSDEYDLPSVYALVRDGFSIVGVERTSWWRRLFGGVRAMTIFARKKAWRSHPGLTRGGTLPISPFRSHSCR